MTGQDNNKGATSGIGSSNQSNQSMIRQEEKSPSGKKGSETKTSGRGKKKQTDSIQQSS